MILNQIIIPAMKLQLQRLNRTPLPKYLGLFWIVVHTFHFGGISPFTPLTALAQSPPLPPWRSQTRDQGNQIAINNRLLNVSWHRWYSTETNLSTGSERFGLQDFAMAQSFNFSLVNTTNPQQQPLEGWADANGFMLSLPARVVNGIRYLDIAPFMEQAGWQVKVDGLVLRITTPTATISGIRPSPGQVRRLVLDMDRLVPYQITRHGNSVTLTVEAGINSSVLQGFKKQSISNALPTKPESNPNSSSGNTITDDSIPENLELQTSLSTSSRNPSTLPMQVDSRQNRTTLIFGTSDLPRISALSRPYRLVLDWSSGSVPSRDLQWAPGVRWQQRLVTLGLARFPLNGLWVNLRQAGLTMRPVWNQSEMLPGTYPLSLIVQRLQSAAAINGGFFNRNNQTPLGAIRRDGQWISGPILNRGAIAWDDTGRVRMARVSLEEVVSPSSGQRIILKGLNTGLVSGGLSRYTPDWGITYSPFTRYEVIITVQNSQVVSQQTLIDQPSAKITIPSDGYLLVLRRDLDLSKMFPMGSPLQLTSRLIPQELESYPHIIGAGPLLLLEGQIVLEGKGESFQPAFIDQKASRSAIGVMTDGTVMLVTVHSRMGGMGPSLTELAQLMQQLGAVSALNLDGGSSTSLYLGGQLLDRPNSTAARVHNGIGIFLR